MKILKILTSRLVVFIIQIAILSIFIFLFNYQFPIDFAYYIPIPEPPEITPGQMEMQKWIVQFLANYVMYGGWADIFFIFSTWLIVSLIPIFMYQNFKKVYTMNLITFFFPNFFFYVFLFRYLPDYFMAYFPLFFLRTLILGFIIAFFSIGLSLTLKIVKERFRKEDREGDLQQLLSESKTICPNCGVEFNSNPEYCYNCNTKLTKEIIEENEERI